MGGKRGGRGGGGRGWQAAESGRGGLNPEPGRTWGGEGGAARGWISNCPQEKEIFCEFWIEEGRQGGGGRQLRGAGRRKLQRKRNRRRAWIILTPEKEDFCGFWIQNCSHTPQRIGRRRGRHRVTGAPGYGAREKVAPHPQNPQFSFSLLHAQPSPQ